MDTVQLASQLKLTDLQERLTQAQQLLESHAHENTQLKELVQGKNHLLRRREELLANMQVQVSQAASQPKALMAAGVAGPTGIATARLTEPTTDLVATENTWQGVFFSPLVWKASSLSVLFLLLVAFWQKRRSDDQWMQLSVQNAILLPDDYVEEEEESRLLDFLWDEDELEQVREQLQKLRYSMASLREQSQRLQIYLQPEPI